MSGGSGTWSKKGPSLGSVSNHRFSTLPACSCLCQGICLMCTVVRAWPRQPSLSATPVQLSCRTSNGRSLVRARVLAPCNYHIPQGEPHIYQVWGSGLILREEGLNRQKWGLFAIFVHMARGPAFTPLPLLGFNKWPVTMASLKIVKMVALRLLAPTKAYPSGCTCCPPSSVIFPRPRGPDHLLHSLPETEAKALLKERQKKDNHNLSE